MEGWTSSELVGQADKQTEEHEEMLHADSKSSVASSLLLYSFLW